MSFWSIVKKIFGFFRTRVGLDAFVKRYKNIGFQIVEELFSVNSGKTFHDWKDEAFDKVKVQLQKDGTEIKGTWVTILTHLAYDAVLAKTEKK